MHLNNNIQRRGKLASFSKLIKAFKSSSKTELAQKSLSFQLELKIYKPMTLSSESSMLSSDHSITVIQVFDDLEHVIIEQNQDLEWQNDQIMSQISFDSLSQSQIEIDQHEPVHNNFSLNSSFSNMLESDNISEAQQSQQYVDEQNLKKNQITERNSDNQDDIEHTCIQMKLCEVGDQSLQQFLANTFELMPEVPHEKSMHSQSPQQHQGKEKQFDKFLKEQTQSYEAQYYSDVSNQSSFQKKY